MYGSDVSTSHGGWLPLHPTDRPDQEDCQQQGDPRLSVCGLGQAGVEPNASAFECCHQQPAGNRCESLQLLLQLERWKLCMRHCLLLFVGGIPLGQGEPVGTALGSTRMALGAGYRLDLDRWILYWRLRGAHAFPWRSLLHLQCHGEWLQSRRWHCRLHHQEWNFRERKGGIPSRNADRPRWAKCQHVCTQRTSAGEMRLGCSSRGQNATAGIHRVGMPWNRDLLGGSHRSGSRSKGPDQRAPPRAALDRQ
mmetsp:Transcript_13752/g.23612  ORF Transcript_13752/g.23612 Transcript_13752/m.23612 type:complete len:251 (+) Transcript_13752:1311-2063(+)